MVLKKDRYFSKKGNPYITFTPPTGKTTQENAGYSNRAEINKVIEVSKQELSSNIHQYLKTGDKILDIGCGPGMYLSLFKNSNFRLYATDINSHMIVLAKQNVSNATFYHGDFNELKVDEKFNFIYCIGVLIYIPPSELEYFFSKIYSMLEDNGIFYLNFPHAISYFDTLFKDITYVQYSPNYIRKKLSGKFEILTDKHASDGRFIESYDKKPYKSLNPDTQRTYKNSYLLIAKKKL